MDENIESLLMGDAEATFDAGVNAKGWDAAVTEVQGGEQDQTGAGWTAAVVAVAEGVETPWADETTTETTWAEVVTTETSWADETPGDKTVGVDSDELQSIMDELWIGADKATETTEDVKEAAAAIQEDIKTTEKVTDELRTQVDDLVSNTVSLEATNKTNEKTIEVLNREYQRVLEENIALKYGNSSWTKVVEVVNNSEGMKNLVATNVLYNKNQDEASKQKLIEASKAYYEELTGASIDGMINSQKSTEADALSSWGDVAFGNVEMDDMFI